MWKERLWQVFLVAILGLTLTMCSRSSSNNSTSNSNTANADGTSTVSVSSLPAVSVSSLPTVSVSSLPTISQSMLCLYALWSSSNESIQYSECDATDNTVSNGIIYHDAAFAAGWRIVGSGCSSGSSGGRCILFHK